MTKLSERIQKNSLEEKDYENEEEFSWKRELKSDIINMSAKVPEGFIENLNSSMEKYS